MNYKDAIEPVTRLKTRSAELIKKARETKQPLIITQNGKAAAVLQDIESFQRQRETILLLKFILQGEQAILQGRTHSHTEARRRIEKKLEELKEFD